MYSMEERMGIEQAVVAKYGADHQIIKTMEELGELQQALARMLNLSEQDTNKDDVYKLIDNVIEETADVQIMVDQLAIIFGGAQLIEQIDRKLRRLAMRVGGVPNATQPPQEVSPQVETGKEDSKPDADVL